MVSSCTEARARHSSISSGSVIPSISPSAQRPAPSAQRPAPSAQRPAPSAQRPAPSAQRPAPSAQRPEIVVGLRRYGQGQLVAELLDTEPLRPSIVSGCELVAEFGEADTSVASLDHDPIGCSSL